jgi:hypothetical protein
MMVIKVAPAVASACLLFLILPVLLPLSAEGISIDQPKLSIGDKWDYKIRYQNYSIYADLEVVDKGVISSFDTVKQVYVVNVKYMFGDLEPPDLPAVTYEADFHQKMYVDQRTLETVRVESYFKSTMGLNVGILSYSMAIYLKGVDDFEFLSGGDATIVPGGHSKQNVEQRSYFEYKLRSNDQTDDSSNSTSDSYINEISFKGSQDISTPAGDFDAQDVHYIMGTGAPFYLMTLIQQINLNIMLKSALSILSGTTPDMPTLDEFDYTDFSRDIYYTKETKMPVMFVDHLGTKLLWTWTLQAYSVSSEASPFMALRTYYYFIAFAVLGLIVATIAVLDLFIIPERQAVKMRTPSVKGSVSAFVAKMEDRLEGTPLKKKKAPAQDMSYYDPDYTAQRLMYEERGYGKAAKRAYVISPREQVDLYKHFGRTDATRNIFDEQYPAPPAPEKKDPGK